MVKPIIIIESTSVLLDLPLTLNIFKHLEALVLRLM